MSALSYAVKKKSKSAIGVVTGCLPQINPEKIQEIKRLENFEYVPTRDLEKFDKVLNNIVKLEEIPEANLVTNEASLFDFVLGYRLFRHSLFLNIYKKMSIKRNFVRDVVFLSETFNNIKRKLGLKTRQRIIPYYNIRIGEGCVFACSFCCIRYATGRLKSKPIDKIVEELKTGLKKGHRLFQLVCEDTGCYGLDIGTTFPDLLKKLLAVDGDYQLIIIDFGGHWLVKYYDELLPLFMENPDKIRELYVSLQSGSDKILKAMNRPEKSEKVRARLKELKKKLPHLILRTTVVVGFPGETEEDFRKTLEALQEIDLSVVELNKYSDRPGIASSKMNDKVPQEIIDRRTKEIEQALARNRKHSAI